MLLQSFSPLSDGYSFGCQGSAQLKKMGGGREEGKFWAEEAPLLSVGGVGMQGPGSEQKGKAGQQEWGGH